MEEKLKILKEIWQCQKTFNRNFMNFEELTDKNRQELTKEMILHLSDETHELLREIKWKMHRQQNIKVNRNNLLEEWIDIFKYWLTIGQIWDATPEEFVEMFQQKSEVVELRYKQEHTLKLLKDENVIAIDIDGVLAQYPESFIAFIEKETGKDFSNIELTTHNLYDLLGKELGLETMKQLKHKYRNSGEKKFLPIIENSVNATQQLKKKGFTIVLLSARPYKQHPRIFADTIYWLKNNNFMYDAIIWGENKEEKIINEFPNMKFMVEDLLENANKVANIGYKVFLLDKTYNQGKTNLGVTRVQNWEEIIQEASKWKTN